MILCASTAFAQNLSTITIRVSNIEVNGSKIFVALYDNEDSFNKKLGTVDSLRIIPKTKTTEVKFKNIKPGNYAVAVFQDINNNGILDINRIKIPQEPIGISNYTTGKILGRPKFKNAQFHVSKDTAIIIPLQ